MPRLQDFDRGYIKRMASLMDTAFPLKLYAHCLCYLPQKAGKHYLVQELISKYVICVMECVSRFVDVDVHIEREEGELLQELLDMGLDSGLVKDCQPRSEVLGPLRNLSCLPSLKFVGRRKRFRATKAMASEHQTVPPTSLS